MYNKIDVYICNTPPGPPPPAACCSLSGSGIIRDEAEKRSKARGLDQLNMRRQEKELVRECAGGTCDREGGSGRCSLGYKEDWMEFRGAVQTGSKPSPEELGIRGGRISLLNPRSYEHVLCADGNDVGGAEDRAELRGSPWRQEEDPCPDRSWGPEGAEGMVGTWGL